MSIPKDFAITDPRFDADYQEPAEPRRKSGWSTCLTGCLIVAVIGVLLTAVGGFIVMRNWRGWTADLMAMGVNDSIDRSDLAPDQKARIRTQVDRVANAFREGRLSNEQAVAIFERLFESPLMTSLVASAVEAKYFPRSNLTEEEKEDGRQTLRRFLRGAADGRIDQQAVDGVMAHVAERDIGGDWNLRDQVTDEQLRAALAEAEQAADAANIADEPEEFDPAEEVERIIDEAMGEE